MIDVSITNTAPYTDAHVPKYFEILGTTVRGGMGGSGGSIFPGFVQYLGHVR